MNNRSAAATLDVPFDAMTEYYAYAKFESMLSEPRFAQTFLWPLATVLWSTIHACCIPELASPVAVRVGLKAATQTVMGSIRNWLCSKKNWLNYG